ncbi:hypothetical protein A6V29_08075 [Blastococcus sp. CCUG 61487]|nr:hypothetical protein A6V29_08075 [Blastococcus sp. CCUG 61487]
MHVDIRVTMDIDEDSLRACILLPDVRHLGVSASEPPAESLTSEAFALADVPTTVLLQALLLERLVMAEAEIAHRIEEGLDYASFTLLGPV